MSRAKEIAIVSLGEAGNLGDDLILLAAIQAISDVCPGAEVSFLSFGEHLEWNSLARRLQLQITSKPLTPTRDWPGSRSHERLFERSDLIVFGGGGLFQTSHNPDQPYHWLSYLPNIKNGPKVLAVGLGLGPISDVWKKRLRSLGSPFDATYLRDPQSVNVARDDLGWPALRCIDFVDGPFLSQFLYPGETDPQTNILGVALRAWPGLSAEIAANHVMDVARRHEIEQVDCFVLESKGGQGVDVQFAESVRRRTSGLDMRIHVYTGENLEPFVHRMGRCEIAISMKLHACAIWAVQGVPMYPIIYAPKIASFFGLPYAGLEIVGHVVPHAQDETAVQRSACIVKEIIPQLLSSSTAPVGRRLGQITRFKFQCTELARMVRNRLRRLFAVGRGMCRSKGVGAPRKLGQ